MTHVRAGAMAIVSRLRPSTFFCLVADCEHFLRPLTLACYTELARSPNAAPLDVIRAVFAVPNQSPYRRTWIPKKDFRPSSNPPPIENAVAVGATAALLAASTTS